MVKRSSIVAAIVGWFALSLGQASCSKSPSSSPEEETYANTIEPIVREKCQACHHPGGIAPFALMTYEDVKAMGGVAKNAVSTRQMPPWGPVDDPVCTNTRAFQNDLSLTQSQIDAFVRWVDRGMPRGEETPAARPTAAFRPLGLVDKTNTFEVASSYSVAAGATDELRCFPVDPGFKEDTWVGESIVIPADPRVVHHVLVYLDPKREGLSKVDSTGSYSCFGGSELETSSLLLAWSPAGTSTTYGQDTGLMIPKDAHLVLQVHYHPIATPTTGRTSLEVKTLPTKPAHEATFLLIGNAESARGTVKLLPGTGDPASGPAFLIPSNAKSHVESMELVSPFPRLKVSAIGAHMHWAGVAMQVQLERATTEADAQTDCLLNTTYDFNWQRTYAYDVPLDQAPIINLGDTLRITCTYDNTEDNRHIARVMHERRMTKPPAIRLGPASTDEMCQAIVVLVD